LLNIVSENDFLNNPSITLNLTTTKKSTSMKTMIRAINMTNKQRQTKAMKRTSK
jgi:ABC-type bacteriocin/lantibiotic exporter with double-glycine peptidase domain